MPHQSIKLTPGVTPTETQALNETGIATSQLIRFTYDPQFGALVQKLGGWVKYFTSNFPAVVRALWAWQDLNIVNHLAVGVQTAASSGAGELAVITAGGQGVITPQNSSDSITPAASTTSGSATVTITDSVTQNITSYDNVFIQTHISVGGVVLFGLYACTYVGATQYTVQAADILGNAVLATSTSTTATVASFAMTSGSATVTVTLAGHGYSAGSTYPILASTTVGGVTLYGNYVVQSVTSTSVFTILATNTATSSTSGSINGGYAALIYAYGYGTPPSGEGYGVGGWGTGGWGGGLTVTPASGASFPVTDWNLGNWGGVLVSSPVVGAYTLPTAVTFTNGSSTIAGTALPSMYGAPVQFQTTGALPTNFAAGTTYYVLGNGSSSSMTVSATVGGAAITAGSAGSGTQTMTIVNGVGPSTNFQPLYVWDPLTGSSIAAVIAAPQAPTVMDGFFIAMPQRQVVCWGTSVTGIQDPLLIRWCDISNYTVWVDLVTNQAGQYRLSTGSRIVGCLQGPQEAYIWTDVGLWTMTYINQPYIYSFVQVGFGCGLIGRKAAGILNGVAYWMGPNQFYSLATGSPTIIECPVWDVAFQDLDPSNVQKIRCAINSRFAEVTWYIPTLTSGGEVAIYVKYNALLNVWDYGTLGRSAWIDQSILGAPIGADPSTLYVYQHETSNDADGAAMVSTFTTGYAVLSEGDEKVFVDEIWPDMKWGFYGGSQGANVAITLNATDFPGTAPISSPTYTVTQSTQAFDPRVRARLLSFTIGSSDVGSFWRLGNVRYRGQPAGRYN